jgi:hypothetical protein
VARIIIAYFYRAVMRTACCAPTLFDLDEGGGPAELGTLWRDRTAVLAFVTAELRVRFTAVRDRFARSRR